MAHTQAETLPSDEEVRPDAPVLGSTVAKLLAFAAWLYSRILDRPVPGEAVTAVTGHDHTGAGNGRSIPRGGFVGWRIPTHTPGGGAAAPTVVDSGYDTSGTTNVADDGASPWRKFEATKALDTTTYHALAVIPLTIRAGAKGLAVRLWRGADLAGAPLNKIEWKVALASSMAAAATVYDDVVEEIAADENATRLSLPRAGYVGTESNAEWLQLQDVGGGGTANDPITADLPCVLIVSVRAVDTWLVDNSMGYLYEVGWTEVPGD